LSLFDAKLQELHDRMHKRELTVTDLVDESLKRIGQVDDSIKAFLTVDEEGARAEAAKQDAAIGDGEAKGLLFGIPAGIKDNIVTKGLRTTCASKLLENFVPIHNATVVDKLNAAQSVTIGKLNMDEFAMGGSTENSHFGPTRNPWNPDHVPGGSSGGAAAAVAAEMVPLSLGSDTGGSIRQPAALCGVTGLKPTYGRVSRYGLVAFASSLDQIGPITRDARDAALLLQAIAGHDEHDSTSADVPVPDYLAAIEQPLAGLKIGVLREQLSGDIDPEVKAAIEAALATLEAQGATLVDVPLPHSKYAVATYYVISASEASSNLARYDGAHYGYRTDERAMRETLRQEEAELKAAGKEAAVAQLDSPLVRMYRLSRSEGFGTEVQRRIMLGTYALSAGYYDAYYRKALQVRRLIRQDYDAAFAQVDLLVGPVTASTAFKIGEKCEDPLSMYLVDLFTVGANLAGIPAMSVPCGFSSDGLPIGLHLQAPAFEEARLLRVGHQYQQVTDWHTRRPAS